MQLGSQVVQIDLSLYDANCAVIDQLRVWVQGVVVCHSIEVFRVGGFRYWQDKWGSCIVELAKALFS